MMQKIVFYNEKDYPQQQLHKMQGFSGIAVSH
jgi:hypothetical protein